MAHAVDVALGVLVSPGQRGVAVRQSRDEPLAFRAARHCDVRLTGGEVLLLLELDVLPGWIAQNHVEAAVPAGGGIDAAATGRLFGREQMWELEVPVEEAVLGRKSLDLGSGGFETLTSLARQPPIGGRAD